MSEAKFLEELFETSKPKEDLKEYLLRKNYDLWKVVAVHGELLIYGDYFFVLVPYFVLDKMAEKGLPLSFKFKHFTVKFWDCEKLNEIQKYLMEVEKWKQVF